MKITNTIFRRSRLIASITLGMLLLCASSGLSEFADGFKLKGGGSANNDAISQYYVVHKSSWQKSKWGRNYMLQTAEYEKLKEDLKVEARIWPAVIRAVKEDWKIDSKIQDDTRIKNKTCPVSQFAARKLTLKAGPIKTRDEAEAKLEKEDAKRIKYYEKLAERPTKTDPMKTRVINRVFQLIEVNVRDQEAKYYRLKKEADAKRRY